MKTVREKFLTVAEAEKATGVHYTVNHSGKNGRDAEFVN